MELNVFESGKIKKLKSFDKTELSYYYSKKDKKTIIFLHGNGSNYTTWSPMLNYFGKDYSVLAPDLRGHGRSERTKNIKLDSFANDTLILMDKERINKAIFVGNSLSSSIILEFYRKFPERVKSMVILTPFSSRFVRFSRTLRMLNKVILSFVRLFKSKRKLRFQNYNKYYKQKKPIWFYPLLDMRGTSLTIYFGTIEELFKYKMDLKNIKKKTLIILGKKDIFLKNKVIKNMTKDNPNIKIKTVNANHVPLAERYEEVMETIEEFVK